MELTVSGNRQKSTVKKRTVNPIWNEKFTFNVSSPQTDVLQLDLYDYETIGDNIHMGSLSVSLNELMQGKSHDRELCLQGLKKGITHIVLFAEDFGFDTKVPLPNTSFTTQPTIPPPNYYNQMAQPMQQPQHAQMYPQVNNYPPQMNGYPAPYVQPNYMQQAPRQIGSQPSMPPYSQPYMQQPQQPYPQQQIPQNQLNTSQQPYNAQTQQPLNPIVQQPYQHQPTQSMSQSMYGLQPQVRISIPDFNAAQPNAPPLE